MQDDEKERAQMAAQLNEALEQCFSKDPVLKYLTTKVTGAEALSVASLRLRELVGEVLQTELGVQLLKAKNNVKSLEIQLAERKDSDQSGATLSSDAAPPLPTWGPSSGERISHVSELGVRELEVVRLQRDIAVEEARSAAKKLELMQREVSLFRLNMRDTSTQTPNLVETGKSECDAVKARCRELEIAVIDMQRSHLACRQEIDLLTRERDEAFGELAQSLLLRSTLSPPHFLPDLRNFEQGTRKESKLRNSQHYYQQGEMRDLAFKSKTNATPSPYHRSDATLRLSPSSCIIKTATPSRFFPTVELLLAEEAAHRFSVMHAAESGFGTLLLNMFRNHRQHYEPT